MKKTNTLINTDYIINSPRNIKLYNNYINDSPSFIHSQNLLEEMQTSIDTILNNLRKNSQDNINLQKNTNFSHKPHLYKTPNNTFKKKIYDNNNTQIINYRYKNNEDNNLLKHNNPNIILFRNNSENKIKNKLLYNNNNLNKIINNLNSEFNINSNIDNIQNNKKLINSILRQIKILKKINYINKNEIIQFKKEYYEMGKIMIKGIQGYLKVFNNNFNLKIKELEKNLSEYKNKYYNLLNNNNYIKEDKQENNFNTKSQDIKYDKKISEAECNLINDKEIQKLKNKYEMMLKQKSDEINELNLQILKLNLEKKKLRHQKIKKHIEDMNLDIENNFNDKKIKEIKFQKSELNLLKHKSFDIRKNPNLKIDKTPTKIKDSDINITSNLSNNEILSENQKLKSEIVVLKSKSNNFIKLYFKYKEISDKLNSENKKLVKERDEYKKKKSELNNEIEIIKINNDRMNNIKIKNNILINNNLTIKNKIHNSIEKIKTIKNNQRSPIIKNKINKNNIKVISNII